MKTTFLQSLFFILILVFGLSAHAVDDESSSASSEYNFDFGDLSCSDNSVPSDVTDLIKTSCNLEPDSKSKQKLTCDCLENAKKENILVSVLSDKSANPQEQLDAKKKEYKERFFDAYEKMLLQDSIQAKILQLPIIEKDEPKVGCSAKTVSTGIKKKIELNGNKHLASLEKLQKDKQSRLEKCKKSACDQNQKLLNEKVLTQIETNIKNLKKSMDPCELSMELLKKELTKAKIQEMRDYFSLQNDFESLKRLSTIETPDSTIPNSEKTCDFVNDFIKNTLTPFKQSKTIGAIVLPGQCDKEENETEGDTTLCEVFNGINADLDKKLKDKYVTDSNDCISNEEFETFKGMPGDEFMKELVKSKSPGDLLTIPQTTNSETEKQQINFLRSNPILAKLSRTNSFKKALGPLLQDLAKKQLVPNKSHKDKFNDYISFMKNDVTELLKGLEVKKDELFVCDELAGNFSAIQIANDLTAWEKNPSNDTYTEKLNDAMISCNIPDFNEAATTDTGAYKKTSPLFTLGLSAEEQMEEEASFEDMKKDICKGYNPAFAAASCDGKMDDNCRANYLGTLPASVEIANVTKGMIDTKMINPHLTVDDINYASSKNDERKQDHEFINWWDQTIGSKLSKDVIAFKGEGDQFIADQKNNLEIASSTNVPDRFLSSNVVSAPGIVSPPVNSNQPDAQGQQIPEYSKDVEPFDVSKLASATSAKEMIPKFESLPPVKQKESLTEFKEFNASQPNSPISQQSIDEEIAKVNNKIEGNIKEISNKIEKISSAAPQIAPTGSAGISQSSPNPISQQSNVATVTQPVVNSHTNSSGGSSAKIDTKSISSKATNKALLQANEFRESEANRQNEGRVPASLLVKDSIQFQKGEVDSTILQPGLLVNQEVLVPDSHAKYEKIRTSLDDLKVFLADQIDPKTISAPKIYRIKDPKKGSNLHMLFYVSKGPSGEISVKAINRKSTLRDLNNTI